MTRLLTEEKPLPVALVYDIKNCGPRHRFVANGKLVHNSGADKVNLQNLPRGGALRKAIRAPKGYALVVSDSSQIEARTLAWFAGQNDLVDEFKHGVDVYSSFASNVYGYQVTKKDHPVERHVGKTCLGADTKVLTKRGDVEEWKPIVEVTTDDLLWDGESWVKHNGVINQGKKDTLTMYGVTATPDHLCWTGTKFEPWETLIGDSSQFQKALDSVSLPSSGTATTSQKEDAHTVGNRIAGVPADGKAE